jgi:hypothetical protein
MPDVNDDLPYPINSLELKLSNIGADNFTHLMVGMSITRLHPEWVQALAALTPEVVQAMFDLYADVIVQSHPVEVKQ